jgi:hypothetical protein
VEGVVENQRVQCLEKSGLSLSAIARKCWETELELSELETDEIRVEAWEDGADVELRFMGSLIVSDVDGNELYLTDKDMLVFVPHDELDYWSAPRDEIDGDNEGLLSFFRTDSEALAAACEALGLKRIVWL